MCGDVVFFVDFIPVILFIRNICADNMCTLRGEQQSDGTANAGTCPCS